MRRDCDDNTWKNKKQARRKYKERQVDKFINWSIKQKGYLKLKELEEQYKEK